MQSVCGSVPYEPIEAQVEQTTLRATEQVDREERAIAHHGKPT